MRNWSSPPVQLCGSAESPSSTTSPSPAGTLSLARLVRPDAIRLVPAAHWRNIWVPHLDDLSGLKALATTDSFTERIEVPPGGWRQSGWFAHREAFGEFRDFWQRNGGFRLHRLTREGDPEPPGNGLTDPQREALPTAYELGYFEIPRKASLEDFAAELDISASSASERLRRAQTQVIEENVATTWPPLPE